MSLKTDIIFVNAIRSNNDLMALLPAGDVYNTTIALPEPEAMNAPLPYIIVSYEGMQNDQSTKDGYEGDFDRVTIQVEVAAETRAQLCDLMEDIRSSVLNYFNTLASTDEDFDLLPKDYQLSASGVQYDDMKPCYWQTFTYICDTKV